MIAAFAFLALFLVLPLVAVFSEALRQGWSAYVEALKDHETQSAIWLTLGIALVVLPFNIAFGIAAAWAIAKFDFRGKSLLTTLIDLPFAVSPVVAGLLFILIFGAQGWFGPWLQAHDIKVIFAVPGMVIATLFISVPYVARELIPLMQAQGREEEEAAVSLGATGFQMFRRVTLPNIKWGLLYGVILYNEYNAVGAFAAASVLALLALVTLIAKTIVEWRMRHEQQTLSAALPPEKTE